ncbi:MAG: XRE family transcriptional regulator [Rhodobacterales bacterium]|nr:MAG: XRE family transcriptional regulator [Rhodobacterales bacterium]
MVIRNLRIERGWSQEQLAEISGVSSRTIQRIERGGKASLESLKCLAAVFETPISDLKKEIDMPNSNAALTEEDRAALRYAHYLKSYDQRHSQQDGLTESERAVHRQVRHLKKFYRQLIIYVLILAVLLVINLLTSDYLWVVWPALGLGISLAFSAVNLLGFSGRLAEEWERRQIEKRLKNL